MKLDELIVDAADALLNLDRSAIPFGNYQPGVGPYGETKLVAAVAKHLNALPPYGAAAVTKRTPDLLLPGQWALEFKIARPFGDNGHEAENWSVNVLHPYAGNVSLIGDCLKLQKLPGAERKGAVVIGYEHSLPKISLTPLFEAFELLASQINRIRLGPRVEVVRDGLRHPVHQRLRMAAWEVS